MVIPAARGNLAERLVWSLSKGTVLPDIVSLVGNETVPFDPTGLNVRLVRYQTRYQTGPGDVCLRRNIGIYFSEADIIIFQDDDQLAPPNMIESAVAVIEQDGYVWGHHRFIDFEDLTFDIGLPPEYGHSREVAPNRLHGWHSCYAGMFGAKRSLLLELGGFDMAFMGRIGNEDQQLGRRLLVHLGREQVYIHEPPFAWHPTQVDKLPSPDPPAGFDLGMVLASPVPVVRFDATEVQIASQWL